MASPPPIVPVRDPFLHPHPGDYNVMTRNNYMADAPDAFDRIAARVKLDDEENDVYLIGDDDWDQVIFDFDERCRWESWEVPLSSGHPLLPALLAERHPYTWFDTGSASTTS